MILVFGGTTEGLKAVKELEEAGKPFFYSTRGSEQQAPLHHGVRLSGTMDGEAMAGFCRTEGIRLLIDAAHPFAAQLHETVAATSRALGIPAIRFERIFPRRDTIDAEWCDSYDEAIGLLSGCRSVLATTGVQSIRRLAPLKAAGIRMHYRILDRESSITLAHAQGATDDELCFYHTADDDNNDDNNTAVFSRLRPDAILMKESGLSGGFTEKVCAARRLGIRVVVIRRPPTPPLFHCVNGEHGLRRMVERLLPGFYPLRSGLTTGTCATAAAVAAVRRMLTGETPPAVPVTLPNGETISVDVIYGDGYAAVVKDSGDDPDVTNGIEVRASLSQSSEFRVQRYDYSPVQSSEFRVQRYDYSQEQKTSPESNHTSALETLSSELESNHTSALCTLHSALEGNHTSALETLTSELEILAGPGVGTITLPGFDYPPGSPAINKVPRRMIRENVAALLNEEMIPNPTLPKGGSLGCFSTIEASRVIKLPPFGRAGVGITISVPGGEEIARRTFNPRLGIVGGISIVGVSGIIKPFSEESFVASIRKCMEVAVASGAERVVINSGAKSERYVRAIYPDLPAQAFVEYGNYIGDTIRMASELGVRRLTLGMMLGKAVKLAAGHLDTHSRRATMDRDLIAAMLTEAGCDETTVAKAETLTLARELWDIVPASRLKAFCHVVISHCLTHCRPLLPDGELTILLIDEQGKIFTPALIDN